MQHLQDLESLKMEIYLASRPGPDYLRQHRVLVEPDHRFVGEGTMSPEGTSELSYLWRAHPCTPHPRPKSTYVGEIGWSLPELNDFNCSNNEKQVGAYFWLHGNIVCNYIHVISQPILQIH